MTFRLPDDHPPMPVRYIGDGIPGLNGKEGMAKGMDGRAFVVVEFEGWGEVSCNPENLEAAVDWKAPVP